MSSFHNLLLAAVLVTASACFSAAQAESVPRDGYNVLVYFDTNLIEMLKDEIQGALGVNHIQQLHNGGMVQFLEINFHPIKIIISAYSVGSYHSR